MQSNVLYSREQNYCKFFMRSPKGAKHTELPKEAPKNLLLYSACDTRVQQIHTIQVIQKNSQPFLILYKLKRPSKFKKIKFQREPNFVFRKEISPSRGLCLSTAVVITSEDFLSIINLKMPTHHKLYVLYSCCPGRDNRKISRYCPTDVIELNRMHC